MVAPHPTRPLSRRGRLRALFDEAWERRRSRHRRIALVVLACAAVAAAVTGTRRGDPPAQPVRLAALVLSQPPGIGVACHEANSFKCDRVGIAASLPDPDTQLDAAIGGRTVRLHNQSTGACPETGCFYSAYMTHAGLLDGPLRVTPDHGRFHWWGRGRVTATIRLTATLADGTRAQTLRHVELSPGWG